VEIAEEKAARSVKPEPPPSPPPPRPPPDRYAPPAEHFDEIARLIAEDGTVVPFLGPGINAGDRDEAWHEGCDYLPDAEELALHLAKRFDYPSVEPKHLAEVSQYVFLAKGRNDLYRTLRRVLTSESPPSSVHRFLAGLPARLEGVGLQPRYQLIVTTNYDDALERAFEEANEEYDLAVYMASGEHRGKFLHVPFDGEPRLVAVPNEYVDFPIDEYGDLDRTVIVKNHGAVDNLRAPSAWKENYVITEDNYIDYLSRSPIETLIPFQILNKLRESHFLFLGYGMRDWSLRVILQRIWGGQRPDRSWAIQRDPDALDREFWHESGVDLHSMQLAAYVQALGDELAARAGSRAGP
jgi:hypothetical protein